MPAGIRRETLRLRYGRQIRTGRFRSQEPEWERLSSYVSTGDFVLDIGANVGHYTVALSRLVGPSGRVFAIEPVPDTFALLAANTLLLEHRNVTLLGIAAAERSGELKITIPNWDGGTENYYRAQVNAAEGSLACWGVALDSILLPVPLSLIKIDVEGFEQPVLAGLRKVLTEYRPRLIIETESPAVCEDLRERGYIEERLPGSPNRLFHPANEFRRA